MNREILKEDNIHEPVYHVDHIKPLAKYGTNDIENLQLLCKICHNEKSFKERENGDYCGLEPFMSTYNNHTFDIFNSNYMKQYAFIERIVFIICFNVLMSLKVYAISSFASNSSVVMSSKLKIISLGNTRVRSLDIFFKYG